MKKFLVTLLAVAGLFTTFAPVSQASEIAVEPTAGYIDFAPTAFWGPRVITVQQNTGQNTASYNSLGVITRNAVRFTPWAVSAGIQTYNIGARVTDSRGIFVWSGYIMHAPTGGTVILTIPNHLVNSNHRLYIRVSSNTAPANGTGWIDFDIH